LILEEQPAFKNMKEYLKSFRFPHGYLSYLKANEKISDLKWSKQNIKDGSVSVNFTPLETLGDQTSKTKMKSEKHKKTLENPIVKKKRRLTRIWYIKKRACY
jgi:hypothetical protein